MRWKPVALSGFLVAAAAPAVGAGGQGLSVDADRVLWPQWQARLQVFTEPMTPGLTSFDDASLRPRSAALFGDYYVTRPYLGQAGGMRVTSGLLTGARGAVFGPGLTTSPGLFGFGSQTRPGLGVSSPDAGGDMLTWPAGRLGIQRRPRVGGPELRLGSHGAFPGQPAA
jgi:hypothetical protein